MFLHIYLRCNNIVAWFGLVDWLMHFTQCPINPVPKTLLGRTLMKKSFRECFSKISLFLRNCSISAKAGLPRGSLIHPFPVTWSIQRQYLGKIYFHFPIYYIYYIGRTNFTFTFHVLFIHFSDKEFLDSCFVCPEKAGKQVTPHRVPCCLKLITELQQRAQTWGTRIFFTSIFMAFKFECKMFVINTIDLFLWFWLILYPGVLWRVSIFLYELIVNSKWGGGKPALPFLAAATKTVSFSPKSQPGFPFQKDPAEEGGESQPGAAGH